MAGRGDARGGRRGRGPPARRGRGGKAGGRGGRRGRGRGRAAGGRPKKDAAEVLREVYRVDAQDWVREDMLAELYQWARGQEITIAASANESSPAPGRYTYRFRCTTCKKGTCRFRGIATYNKGEFRVRTNGAAHGLKDAAHGNGGLKNRSKAIVRQYLVKNPRYRVQAESLSWAGLG